MNTKKIQLEQIDGLKEFIDDIEAKVFNIDIGDWDPADPFPGGPTVEQGNYVNVIADGTRDGEEFQDGDKLFALIDNPSTTTYAANWKRDDNADQVVDVRGEKGSIAGVPRVVSFASAPTINDDDSINYEVGDIWRDTAGAVTYDLDDSTPGAAVWVARGGGANLYTQDDTIGAGRVATLTDTLTFTGGSIGVGVAGASAYKMQIKGDSTGTTATWSLWVKDSANNSSFIVKDNLDVHVASKLGVGINTSPALGSEALHVGGDTLIEGTTTLQTLSGVNNSLLIKNGVTNAVQLFHFTGFGGYMRLLDAGGSVGWEMTGGGNTPNYMNTTNRFGFGTSTPNALVNINSTTTGGTAVGLTVTNTGVTRANLFYLNGFGGYMILKKDGGANGFELAAEGTPGYINTGQPFGIGTSSPQAGTKLHVAGNTLIEGTVKIVDATQGAGKVFTSDANGLGSWQTPSVGANLYTSNGTLGGNRSVAQNNSDLTFTTTGGGSTLHIDGVNGNVGIGSSTPPVGKKFYVNGDSHFAGDVLIDDELHILNGIVKNETTLGSFLTEHAFLNNIGTQGQILAGGSTYGVGGNLELITNSFGIRGTNDFAIGARSGSIKFSIGSDFTNVNTRVKFTSTGAIFGAAVGLVAAGAELHVQGDTLIEGNTTINGDITQATPAVLARTIHLASQLPADHKAEENYSGGWNYEITRFGAVTARLSASLNSIVQGLEINGDLTQAALTPSGRVLHDVAQIPSQYKIEERYQGGWNYELTNNSIVKARIASTLNSWLGIDAGSNFGIGIAAPTAKLHVAGDTLIEGDVNIGALTANPNARLTVEVPAATGVGTVWKDTTGDIVTIGRNGAGAGQIDVVGLLGDIKFGGTVSSYVNNKLPFAVNGISGGAAFNVYSDAGAAIQYLYDRNDDLSFTFLAETNNNKFDIYNYGGGSIQHQFRSNGNDSYVNGTTAANFGVGTSTPTARFNTLGSVKMESLPVHADEAAAIVAGLTTDSIYKTATGELRIKL